MPVLKFPSLEALEELQRKCVLRESDKIHPAPFLDEMEKSVI